MDRGTYGLVGWGSAVTAKWVTATISILEEFNSLCISILLSMTM